MLNNGFASTEELTKKVSGLIAEDARSDMSMSVSASTIELSSECTLTEEDLKDEFEAIADDQTEHSAKKSWVHRLNPFHIGEIPPVPQSDAGLVPEMNASWLSKLTWGWLSPLMIVIPTVHSLANLLEDRLSTATAKGRPLALRRRPIDTDARR